jgi:hypothetical protein
LSHDKVFESSGAAHGVSVCGLEFVTVFDSFAGLAGVVVGDVISTSPAIILVVVFAYGWRVVAAAIVVPIVRIRIVIVVGF